MSRLLVLAAGLWAGGACSNESTTELNPAGPPMIRQVFVQEKVDVANLTTITEGLAFGNHDQRDDDDDRMVTRALADGNQEIRIVLDELLLGHTLEEVECKDGFFSRIPPGATPQDVADCMGNRILDSNDAEIQETCVGEHAICICPSEDLPCADRVGVGNPAGILDIERDGNMVPDGAPDTFRMIDYSGLGCPGNLSADLGVQVVCDGLSIPLNCEASFWQPSGNQLIPAGPIDYRGLGPVVVLIPSNGLRSGASCTIQFRDEVTDKDGNTVCAPPDGDITKDCTPGDTDVVTFGVEQLTTTGGNPRDGAVDVNINVGSTMGDAVLRIGFTASLDAMTLGAITLNDGVADVAVTAALDTPNTVLLTVAGGLTAATTYTITIGTGLADVLGGTVSEPITVTFTTAA